MGKEPLTHAQMHKRYHFKPETKYILGEILMNQNSIIVQKESSF